MGKNHGLTNTEMEVMDFLWEHERASFKEISMYFNDVQNKNWKKQTLNTYLANLQRSGVIAADTSGKHYLYYSLYSKEELIHQWTKKMVQESFDNSISDFVAAFTGGKKLSKEDAERIKKMI